MTELEREKWNWSWAELIPNKYMEAAAKAEEAVSVKVYENNIYLVLLTRFPDGTARLTIQGRSDHKLHNWSDIRTD